MHPHLIANKLALFRATNRLPVKITLGMLRNGGVVLVEIAFVQFVIFEQISTKLGDKVYN